MPSPPQGILLDTELSEHSPPPQGAYERSYERYPAFEGLPFAPVAHTATERHERPPAHRLCGYGKVILLGEHAVVYGSHAIAAPIPLAMRASVQKADEHSGASLSITHDGVTHQIEPGATERDVPERTVQLILAQLGLAGHTLQIQVSSTVPRAMGLGSSAAFAVAVIRALDWHFRLGLDDAQVNVLAFRCEELAHGTPSGIDNTVATYGELVLYRRGEEARTTAQIQPLKISRPLPLVIGVSGRGSLTVETVAAVRKAWQREPVRYQTIFRQIDDLVLEGVQALHNEDLPRLGALMDTCHQHLQGLQVSSRELDEMVRIAHEHGALGAKLTGGGRGGSIIALCPANRERVASALRAAGYQALEMDLG